MGTFAFAVAPLDMRVPPLLCCRPFDASPILLNPSGRASVRRILPSSLAASAAGAVSILHNCDGRVQGRAGHRHRDRHAPVYTYDRDVARKAEGGIKEGECDAIEAGEMKRFVKATEFRVLQPDCAGHFLRVVRARCTPANCSWSQSCSAHTHVVADGVGAMAVVERADRRLRSLHLLRGQKTRTAFCLRAAQQLVGWRIIRSRCPAEISPTLQSPNCADQLRTPITYLVSYPLKCTHKHATVRGVVKMHEHLHCIFNSSSL